MNPMTVDPASDGEVEALRNWLRAPDYAEGFSLADITDWLNGRPVALFERVASRLTTSEETARAATERAVKAEEREEKCERIINDLCDERATLQSQVASLRGALEPFAGMADFHNVRSDLDVVYVRLSDLRRARSTLAAVEEKETGE